MKALGYGKEYQYPHDAPEGYVAQEYLPDALKDASFYRPGDRGFERKIAERLAWWRQQAGDSANFPGREEEPSSGT
jgi:putative ATPase